MTQAILKICTAKVRRAAIENCGGALRKSEGEFICANKTDHLHPMVTGYCHSGWHEGNKINKPTCRFWVNCPCDCHTLISRMAAMTETPRIMVDNSTWVPDRTGLVNVSLSEVTRTAALAKPDAKLVISEKPGITPDRVEREFATTESGRAARGQLESWVHAVIEFWVDERPENCTPKWIAKTIMEIYNPPKPPSTGAIDAVFRRWESYGYAIIGSAPTRFVSFTPQGLTDGLEALKARAKRNG